MKMAHLLLWLVICSTLQCYGQSSHKPVSDAYTGIGAYSQHAIDAFSFLNNQAALAKVKNAEAGVLAEKRFLLDELSAYTAALVLPTHAGNFGFRTNYYGHSDYNESVIGLAYARNLGSRMDLGVQFNYNRVLVSGYGSASVVSAEIGTIIHVSQQLHTGIHINNPVAMKFGKNSEEKLPSVYSFGIGYEPSSKSLLNLEIVKEDDEPVTVNAGFQYRPMEQVVVRAGISSATSQVWMGAGVLWKNFRIDVMSSYHSQLGLSPGLLFLMNFKKKAE